MIPFAGESVGIDDAAGVAYDTIRRRGSIGSAPATATLAGGDEWRAWVYDGSQNYLEDDTTDVAVSWVVEVVSGSATVTASMGLDPDYGDPGAAHGTILGSHTVTAGTLVLPTTLTAADVMSGGAAMMLVLECSAGSVEVAQVKLRVWPAAGVAGGWSATFPGFDTAPATAPVRYGAENALGQSSNVDPETAWDDAYDDFAVQVAAMSAPASRPVSFTASTTANASQGSAVIDVFTGEIQSSTVLGVSFAVFLGADWRHLFQIDGSLVEGVDWIIPPTEVPDESPEYLLQRDGDGSTGWLNAVVTVTTTGSGDDDMPGQGVAASEAGTFTPVSGAVTLALNHAGSAGVVPLNTSGQDIAVTMSHTVASGDGATWPPTWDHPGTLGLSRVDNASFVFGVDGVPVQTFATLPPYRVWSPAVVVSSQSPHLIFWRSDNLGAGASLVFGQDTRQSSGLVFSNP